MRVPNVLDGHKAHCGGHTSWVSRPGPGNHTSASPRLMTADLPRKHRQCLCLPTCLKLLPATSPAAKRTPGSPLKLLLTAAVAAAIAAAAAAVHSGRYFSPLLGDARARASSIRRHDCPASRNVTPNLGRGCRAFGGLFRLLGSPMGLAYSSPVSGATTPPLAGEEQEMLAGQTHRFSVPG